MRCAKTLGGLGILVIALIVASFFLGRLSTDYSVVHVDEVSTGTVVETGVIVEVVTGTVDTGVVASGSLSGEAIDEEVAATSNIAYTCKPGPQPTEAAGNYAGNSEILNAWLFENTCTFENSNGQTWSDDAKLVLTLHKPTTTKNQVFFYFFGNNVAGRLEAVIGSKTIEFPLNEVVVFTKVGTVKFNLAAKLENTDEQEFGGYVAIFDGNYIESVEIVD